MPNYLLYPGYGARPNRPDRRRQGLEKQVSKSERQATIVDDLKREPALRVNEMAQRYGVSSETIRRDLSELTGKGLLNRTYGGAVRILSEEPKLSEREFLNVALRKQIAAKAATLIVPDDVLLVGGGITTRYFARAMSGFAHGLTVITTSFGVATEFGGNPNVRIFMLPGQFNANEGQVEGIEALEGLTRFRGSKAIIGASGISTDGVSDAAIPAGRLYESMSKRAEQTLVLADSSKFGVRALAAHVRWGPEISLVTDRLPAPDLQAAIASAQGRIILP